MLKLASDGSLQEGKRLLQICNACRYCEGLCPVFPEMTLYRNFDAHNISYLANLCHNCKSCYHGCQYAQPHEFNVNVPKTFAAIRQKTYSYYAFPRAFGVLFARGGTLIGLLIAVSIALVFMAAAYFTKGNLWAVHTGAGAFYQIIPLWLMAGVPTVISFYVLLTFWISFGRFWADIDGRRMTIRAWYAAIKDILTMRHMDGSPTGHGCTHTDERFSHTRRLYHQAVFYGFMLAFASTSVAAFYHHAFALHAPYAFTSIPVILGTAGGILMLIGTAGLAYIKYTADPHPTEKSLLGMEYAFICLLFFVNLTGLLLLFLRDSAWMPTLLCIHLGFVFTFFLIIPYSKFIHALYRLAALLKYALNQQGR